MTRPRRSMLFCPASSPKMLINSSIYKPDCLIFDLEDSVKYSEKDSARDLLVSALETLDFGNCEVFARINPLYTQFGVDDVKELVKVGLTRIRLPMCETTEDIGELDSLLSSLEKKYKIEPQSVKVQCALETPLGVHNALQIASFSKRVISISFGAEDYTRTLGINRSKDAKELFLARSQVVQAAAIAGVDAIDTVYSDYSDTAGFESEVISARDMGFTGKSCIHPSQIDIVHNVFTPSRVAIDKSLEILHAARKEQIENGGVITLNGKMIDKPVIAKAQRIVSLAIAAGLIEDK